MAKTKEKAPNSNERTGENLSAKAAETLKGYESRVLELRRSFEEMSTLLRDHRDIRKNLGGKYVIQDAKKKRAEIREMRGKISQLFTEMEHMKYELLIDSERIEADLSGIRQRHSGIFTRIARNAPRPFRYLYSSGRAAGTRVSSIYDNVVHLGAPSRAASRSKEQTA